MTDSERLREALVDLISCAETYDEFNNPAHDFYFSLHEAKEAAKASGGLSFPSAEVQRLRKENGDLREAMAALKVTRTDDDFAMELWEHKYGAI